MQKCRLLSFFLTSTMALHQALWLGLMALDSNISLRWFLTSSTIGGGIHLNRSFKRSIISHLYSMLCRVSAAQPRSNWNMSWYSARSQQAASTNSGAHESRPLKSSSLNSLPCLLPNCQLWDLQVRVHIISNLQSLRLRRFRHW